MDCDRHTVNDAVVAYGTALVDRSGSNRGGDRKGLAASTIVKAWQITGAVLRLAVRDGLIARSPAYARLVNAYEHEHAPHDESAEAGERR